MQFRTQIHISCTDPLEVVTVLRLAEHMKLQVTGRTTGKDKEWITVEGEPEDLGMLQSSAIAEMRIERKH